MYNPFAHKYMETSHVASKPPAEKVIMSSTHSVVQIIIELMISTCPDSSDGRALDM